MGAFHCACVLQAFTSAPLGSRQRCVELARRAAAFDPGQTRHETLSHEVSSQKDYLRSTTVAKARVAPAREGNFSVIDPCSPIRCARMGLTPPVSGGRKQTAPEPRGTVGSAPRRASPPKDKSSAVGRGWALARIFSPAKQKSPQGRNLSGRGDVRLGARFGRPGRGGRSWRPTRAASRAWSSFREGARPPARARPSRAKPARRVRPAAAPPDTRRVTGARDRPSALRGRSGRCPGHSPRCSSTPSERFRAG